MPLSPPALVNHDDALTIELHPDEPLSVTSEDGGTAELGPGVWFVAREGWRGSWDVRTTVRKFYVIRRAQPAGGAV